MCKFWGLPYFVAPVLTSLITMGLSAVGNFLRSVLFLDFTSSIDTDFGTNITFVAQEKSLHGTDGGTNFHGGMWMAGFTMIVSLMRAKMAHTCG